MKTYSKLALAVLIAGLFMGSPALAQQPQQKLWTFEAEALFLHRNQSRGVSVVKTTGSNSTSSPRLALGTNNIRFSFKPGARFTLGFHPDSSNSIELSYFGLQHFKGTASTNCNKLKETEHPGCIAPVFSGNEVDPGAFDFEDFGQVDNGAQAAKLKYESGLHSVEVNYKRHFSPLGNFIPTALVGFRFMSVPEKFSIAMLGEDGNICCNRADMNIKTKNHLFGVQIGGDGTYRMGPVDVSLRGKAGLYANSANQRTAGCETSEGCDDKFSGKRSGTAAAGVLEAGLIVTWNMLQNVALTAGYNILYVAGLALAPENMPTTNARGAISQLDNSGSAVYHGPSVGAKFSW